MFSLFSKAGELDAGAGLSKTGSVLNVGTASASRIVVNADNIDLATTGVVASTYRSVTVDAYGRVTGGTNPTTLAGYGITDAAPLSHVGSGGTAHAEATTTVAGFMSAADKTKLDNAYHTGNLSFGSGLSYSGGVLTASGGTATNLSGGYSGAIPYQSATNTTTFGNLRWDNTNGILILNNTNSSIQPANRGLNGVTGFTLSVEGGSNDPGSNNTSQTGGDLLLTGGYASSSVSSTSGTITGGNVDIRGGRSLATYTNAGVTRVGGYIRFSTAPSTAAAGTHTTIERFRILPNGAWSVGPTGADTGTSGQVLTSNGSGSAPTWQSAPAAAAGTLTGSTLASGVTASSLTSVGTLSSLAVTGNVSVSTGYTQRSVGTGIAAAGTTQGTATALNREINVVSTVASGTGVILPSSIGTTFIVMNTGANALNVYPASGAAIDSLATNAAFSLSVGAKIMFIQSSATQYHTLNATFA